MRYIHFFFLLFTLSASCVNAQVINAEKEFFSKDLEKNKLKANLGFSMSLIEQQATIFNLSLDNSFAYFTEKSYHALFTHFRWIRFGDTQALRDGYIQYRSNIIGKRLFSFEPFLHVQFDNNRGLAMRFQHGLGLKIRPIKGETKRITLGAALMGEYEQWLLFDREVVVNGTTVIKDLDEEFYKPKTSLYIDVFFKVHKIVDLNLVCIYQAPFDSFSTQRRVLADMNFIFNLNDKFSFRTGLNATSDFIPDTFQDAGIRPIMYFFSQGVNFSF